MTFTINPGAIKKFRRTAWEFQQTFRTPLKNLPPFVSTILSALEPLDSASLTIDGAVFEPKNLLALMSRHSLPPEHGHDCCVSATGREQAAELLEAALGDWMDFLFVPAPKPFVLYADHDEYTTFLASRKSNLNGVIHALTAAGFEPVANYERKL